MRKIQREFYKIYYNLDKMLLLFFTIFAIMEFVWIPLNSWVSENLLAMTGYAYLSPTNMIAVLSSNVLVACLFVLLFAVNSAIAYFELALLFTGVWQLLDNRVKRLSEYLYDVFDSMLAVIRNSTPSKVLFLLLYSVILLPFLRRILNIYYFNKIVVPQFIVDYLSTTFWQSSLMFLILLLFFWLAMRFMYAIPQIYFEHKNVKESIVESWLQTKGKRQFSFIVRLMWLVSFPILLFTGVGISLYLFQTFADAYLPTLSHYYAIVSYILLRLFYYGVIALFMTALISMLTGKQLPIYRRKRLRHRLRLTILLFSSLVFGFQGWTVLYEPLDSLPVTISHRGVDGPNAVQNSIEALEKTAQLQPDFIEMDVQETKDGQFVVMHDINLKKLTGQKGGTHDYSLAEMLKMTVTENGKSAPVASFDQYLQRADELGQKLLVEIKVTRQDSPELVQNFMKRYGERLVEKGHQMQSLDYATVQKIKDYHEGLVSYFILPFNSIYPTTVSDGYTMEYTSLDENFISKSWLREKGVYAWTPNDKDSMLKMLFLQVDGIITDEMSLLQSLIKDLRENRRYADLFMLEFQSLLYNFE